MEVLFCFDHFYEQHFGVAVTSLLVNNPEQVSRVHIITDRSNKLLQQKLNTLKRVHSIEFSIYEIDSEKFDHFKLSAHFSIAVYFRLLATEVLPKELEKVLYLDSDLVVIGSLHELYNLDISEYALAAWGHPIVSTKKRLEMQSDRYFNSGVMLINLQAWRCDQIALRACDFVKKHPQKIKFPDQDALNKIVDGNFLHLPQKWNALVDLSTGQSQVNEETAIAHFVGSLKPWQAWCFNPAKKIYWTYLRQSPWSKALPILPKNWKQILSAGRYVWEYVRRGRLKSNNAN